MIKRVKLFALQIAEIQSLRVFKIQEPGERQITNPSLLQKISAQQAMPTTEAKDIAVEINALFILGILLPVLIIIVILRNYRRN